MIFIVICFFLYCLSFYRMFISQFAAVFSKCFKVVVHRLVGKIKRCVIQGEMYIQPAGMRGFSGKNYRILWIIKMVGTISVVADVILFRQVDPEISFWFRVGILLSVACTASPQ